MARVHKLPSELSRRIHAYSVVDSIFTVFLELLCLSLAAEATEISVILDLSSLSIAVLDNGNGFPELMQDNKAPLDSGLNPGLECISSSCAYLFLVAKNGPEINSTSLGQDMDQRVLSTYMKHFQVAESRFRSIVMACRLFSHLPIRARISRAIPQKKLKRQLRKIVFLSLLQNPGTLVSIQFVGEKPWLSIKSSNTVEDLFQSLYNAPTLSIDLEDAKIHVVGFVAAVVGCSFQLIKWSDSYVQLTAVERNALNDKLSSRDTLNILNCNRSRLSFYLEARLCTDQSSLVDIPMSELLQLISPHTHKPQNSQNELRNPQFSAQVQNQSEHFNCSVLDTQALGEAVVLSQIANQILLAHINDGIYFIDQHACDERYQFEQFLSRFLELVGNESVDVGVKLEHPIPFAISEDNQEILEEYRILFFCFGISYKFEAGFCQITHLPFCMKSCSPQDGTLIGASLLTHATKFSSHPIKKYSDWFSQVREIPSCIYDALALCACHLSVKFGQILNTQEQEYLVQNLRKCRLPFQCAHGRPTIIPMTSTDLGSFNDDLQL